MSKTNYIILRKISLWLWKVTLRTANKKFTKIVGGFLYPFKDTKLMIIHTINRFNPEINNTVGILNPPDNLKVSEDEKKEIFENIIGLAPKGITREQVFKKINELYPKFETKYKRIMNKNKRILLKLKNRRLRNKKLSFNMLDFENKTRINFNKNKENLENYKGELDSIINELKNNQNNIYPELLLNISKIEIFLKN